MNSGEAKFKQERLQMKKQKGCGDLCGTYFSYLKVKAKQANREFNLTPEYLWGLFLFQKEKCALTGVKLHMSTKIDKNNNIERTLHTASLDRINNDLPYIEGNVQWVHKVVNRMRRQWSVEDYVYWCTLVFKHANPEPSQVNDIFSNLEGATTNGRGLSTDKSDTSAQQLLNKS